MRERKKSNRALLDILLRPRGLLYIQTYMTRSTTTPPFIKI